MKEGLTMNNKESKEEESEYSTFIKQALAVGFTDDQVDFLERWIRKEYDKVKPQEESSWENDLADLLDENKPTKIKSFIKSLLAKQREEIIKEIKEIPKKEIIGSSSFNKNGSLYEDETGGQCFNQALDEILDLISKI